MVTNLEPWLEEMSTQSMPGGVAACALAAAMGAALIAKALRVSLRREMYAETDRAAMTAVFHTAEAERASLARLAEADVQAYRAVIDTRSRPAGDPDRGRAWQAAIEVPLAVSEACYRLLDDLGGVLCQCWPGVCIDYEIGSELLRAGARGGRLAAQANLKEWGEDQQATPFRVRVEALMHAEFRQADV